MKHRNRWLLLRQPNIKRLMISCPFLAVRNAKADINVLRKSSTSVVLMTSIDKLQRIKCRNSSFATKRKRTTTNESRLVFILSMTFIWISGLIRYDTTEMSLLIDAALNVKKLREKRLRWTSAVMITR